jgi:hypothetical protein
MQTENINGWMDEDIGVETRAGAGEGEKRRPGKGGA